jgi:hypothetical protein
MIQMAPKPKTRARLRLMLRAVELSKGLISVLLFLAGFSIDYLIDLTNRSDIYCKVASIGSTG